MFNNEAPLSNDDTLTSNDAPGSNNEAPKVTILVGKTKFCLNREELCDCSPYFKAALAGSFREATEQEVQLVDHDDETFEIFVRWLKGESVSKFEEFDWSLLCRFFILMDYLGISSVEKTLLGILRSKRHKSGRIPISRLPLIYNNTPHNSPLRRLWIGWVMECPAPEIFDNKEWEFPEEFLRELVVALMRDRERIARKLKSAEQRAGMSVMKASAWAEDLAAASRPNFPGM
jgi:hypothetical protein